MRGGVGSDPDLCAHAGRDDPRSAAYMSTEQASLTPGGQAERPVGILGVVLVEAHMMAGGYSEEWWSQTGNHGVRIMSDRSPRATSNAPDAAPERASGLRRLLFGGYPFGLNWTISR